MSSCDVKCEKKSMGIRGVPGPQGCTGPQGVPGEQGCTGMVGLIFHPLEVPTQNKIPPKEPHKTCAICFDAIADMVLIPCSHNLYCSMCVAAIPEPIQCPSCRVVVTNFALMKPFNFT